MQIDELTPPIPAWWWLPCLSGWGVFLAVEIHSAANPFDLRSGADWLLRSDFDTLAVLAFLVLAPVAWWMDRFRRASMNSLSAGRWSASRLMEKIGKLLGPIDSVSEPAPLGGQSFPARVRPVWMSIVVAATSLAASLAVGARFDDLPPAYHDEYSYLFQARTFLEGRVSYPSHAAARLFDQMHVLNEGQFASRYFPGTGLWMAPCVAAGHPYWGHWLAGAFCAVLMFWIAREFAGDAGGLVAGLLTALSPGMALFSNLLLAHHPTLVGLGTFLLGFFRMIRFSSWRWGLLSGAGLAFAMICRPMTAAGVALPFAIWFLIWALRHKSPWRAAGGHRFDENWSPPVGRTVISCTAALTLPLALTLAGLFPYNKAITGNGWLAPYSLYTSLHTPSHVYGFNNVERGRQQRGPRVIENYDNWAENLTPALAMANVGTRWGASWKWTLGLMPLTLALSAGFVLWRRLPIEAWLVLAAILALHAVHIPYWFAGMEDHHYVFESGPLWTVWVAVITVEAARAWNSTGHRAMNVWWASLLIATVVMNWAVLFVASPDQRPGQFNGGQFNTGQLSNSQWSAPLAQGINRVAFAREKHGRFNFLVSQRAVAVPALVLVEADPADRHIDYVINPPDLQAAVLIAHYLPDQVPVSDVRRLFPDRKLFLYRVRQDEWRDLN